MRTVRRQVAEKVETATRTHFSILFCARAYIIIIIHTNTTREYTIHSVHSAIPYTQTAIHRDTEHNFNGNTCTITTVIRDTNGNKTFCIRLHSSYVSRVQRHSATFYRVSVHTSMYLCMYITVCVVAWELFWRNTNGRMCIIRYV